MLSASDAVIRQREASSSWEHETTNDMFLLSASVFVTPECCSRPFTPACCCTTSVLRHDSTLTTVLSVMSFIRTHVYCVLWQIYLSGAMWQAAVSTVFVPVQPKPSLKADLFPGFLAVRGMLSDWRSVDAEGAWWNTNPCRSTRSSSSCPLSLGSMVAAGNATSVPKTTAPGWVKCQRSRCALSLKRHIFRCLFFTSWRSGRTLVEEVLIAVVKRNTAT